MRIISQRVAGGVIAAEKTGLNGLLRANRNAFLGRVCKTLLLYVNEAGVCLYT